MRRSVKTSYRKAASTPSSRLRASQSVPGGISEAREMSPLAQYIAENESSGLPVSELIEQFQEYDCEHRKQSDLAASAEKRVVRCEDCGRVATIVRPGAG